MKFYSVKMRATLNDKHVSGGERITTEESIQKVVSELLARPKEFDFINIKIEKINNIKFIEKSLDVKTINVKNHKKGNEIALKLLEEVGIDREVAKAYIDLLHTGANPDRENMRGAMIITKSGKRVEKDRYRGVRTTNVDFLHREEVKKYC
jgi:Pimeloyl-CoA synthetase